MDFYKHDPLSVGAKGLVYIGDDVLVYRRDTKTPKYPLHIDVPGGSADEGETPYETFKREVKEEFGLDITEKDIVYSKRYDSESDPGKFSWYAVARLPMESKAKIAFGDEGLEYMIMSLSDFLKRDDAWSLYQQRAVDYISSNK